MNRDQIDADRRKDRMSEAQRRRRLEELRREQEALSRQVDALSQRYARRSRDGSPRSAPNALDRAIERMREAADNLRRGDAGQAAASGREALQNLRDQEKTLQRRQAIARNARKPKSGSERLAQAADSAAALLQRLENLRREAESFSRGQSESDRSGRDRRLSATGREADRSVELDRLRDALGRSRGLARGLLNSWARGQDWAVSARSIHRELSRRQIEEFLNQPELWQSLLTTARELAKDLRAETEARRLKDEPFSPSQQAPPDSYKSLVENYYRSLSERDEKRD